MHYKLTKDLERGQANHGWLHSKHSFSYAGYINFEAIRFGALRALNEDKIAPGFGLSTHKHKEMEIISIPLQGTLKHTLEDGEDLELGVGEYLVLSSGTGIKHSENNSSLSQELKFIQLWIHPETLSTEPKIQTSSYKQKDLKDCFYPLVAPKIFNTPRIEQNAWIYLSNFTESFRKTYYLNKASHGIYVFVLEGTLWVGTQKLCEKDGIAISKVDSVPFLAETYSSFIIVEVPLYIPPRQRPGIN